MALVDAEKPPKMELEKNPPPPLRFDPLAFAVDSSSPPPPLSASSHAV